MPEQQKRVLDTKEMQRELSVSEAGAVSGGIGLLIPIIPVVPLVVLGKKFSDSLLK